MKKLLLSIMALILCFCIIMPTTAFASQKEVSYSSVEEYVAESQDDFGLKVEIVLSKVLNKLSNLFLNDILGGALKLIIPDSAAVADYEEFDINSYGNFYQGMDTFIDAPQGEKVWSLGYGKASVLPDCFGFGRALPTVAAHSGIKGFSTGKLFWDSSVPIPFDTGKWLGIDG